MAKAPEPGFRARLMFARLSGVASLAVAAVLVAVRVVPATPPGVFTVAPLQLLLLGLVSVLVLAAAGRRPPFLSHLCAASVLAGAAVLAGVLPAPTAGSGVMRAVAWWIGACPPPLVGVSVLLLGGGVYWLNQARWQALGVLLNTSASAALFLLGVGHVFGAVELVAPAGVSAAHPLVTALLFILSLAALGLHQDGPLAAYAGGDPGAVAKRRLLPAAVLTPIASGYLLVYALQGKMLSPTLAVAVTVFANVLVMLLLVNAAGNKVRRVVWDRQRRMEAREARVRRQGMRDSLTQLLNRRGWDAELESWEKAARRDGGNACIVVIDLDGLKQVNDREGHKAGDVLIQRAAAALRRAARRGEPLARLGGDEFAYLVTDCDESTAQEISTRFESALRQAGIGASVGYAMRGRGTLAKAFEMADAQMYRQKRERKRRRA